MLGISFSSTSHAYGIFYFTGKDLLKFCESDKSGERSFCSGYLIGLADMYDVIAYVEATHKAFCLSQDVTGSQLRKVFIDYANDHPEEQNNPAAANASMAYSQAFPCE